MTPPRPARWRRVAATLLFLVPIVGFVVVSSLRVGGFECEVCIVFEGRRVCRTVKATTEAEGLRGATDNACGILTSGVTKTLRCTRTPPVREGCRPT